MNFTEEEFYGNMQGKVLEDGEVDYGLNQNEQNNNQSQKLTFAILTTFLKTFIVLIGALFYITMVTVCLAPAKAIKIFNFADLNKAELFCYEQIYKKEQTLSSLYNLVQKSIENKDYKKTSKYISELQGKNDYVNFCLKVNEASIKTKDKEYIAYVGDLDGYLVSQNILALYSKGQKEEALSVAKNDLKNTNIYSFGLYYYVTCVLEDDSILANQEKDVIIDFALSEFSINGQTKSVLDFAVDRLALLEVSDNLTDEDKILRTYTSLKINYFLLKVYDACGNSEKVSEVVEKIESLKTTYNILINN